MSNFTSFKTETFPACQELLKKLKNPFKQTKPDEECILFNMFYGMTEVYIFHFPTPNKVAQGYCIQYY